MHHGRAVVEELKLLMEAGYSLESAIRCASLNGALLLNLENELGCLKPGMPASFVVTRGVLLLAGRIEISPRRIYSRHFVAAGAGVRFCANACSP